MNQRLQKLIASAGIASRRHAEDLIVARQVTVNGEVIVELGAKADPETDHIKVKGRLINPLLSQQKPVYVLLNKPKGYLTSMSDPEGRPLVIDLIPSSLGRLHPVGRLDFNTEGLLLLTNDGDFTRHITAAKSRIPKVYLAKVKGMPPDKAVERLRRGIAIDDERKVRAEVRMLRESKTNAWFEVILHEGRNQQVRRMFDAIGHSVIKLVRTRIGNLEEKNLKPGRWRKLNEREVKTLKGPHQTRTATKRNTQSKTKQQQTRTTTRRRREGGKRV
jgi:pseudouridine synthase